MKDYLLQGYTINKERTVVTNENFNNLLVVVNDIKSTQLDMNIRVNKLEDKVKLYHLEHSIKDLGQKKFSINILDSNFITMLLNDI